MSCIDYIDFLSNTAGQQNAKIYLSCAVRGQLIVSCSDGFKTQINIDKDTTEVSITKTDSAEAIICEVEVRDVNNNSVDKAYFGYRNIGTAVNIEHEGISHVYVYSGDIQSAVISSPLDINTLISVPFDFAGVAWEIEAESDKSPILMAICITNNCKTIVSNYTKAYSKDYFGWNFRAIHNTIRILNNRLEKYKEEVAIMFNPNERFMAFDITFIFQNIEQYIKYHGSYGLGIYRLEGVSVYRPEKDKYKVVGDGYAVFSMVNILPTYLYVFAVKNEVTFKIRYVPIGLLHAPL